MIEHHLHGPLFSLYNPMGLDSEFQFIIFQVIFEMLKQRMRNQFYSHSSVCFDYFLNNEKNIKFIVMETKSYFCQDFDFDFFFFIQDYDSIHSYHIFIHIPTYQTHSQVYVFSKWVQTVHFVLVAHVLNAYLVPFLFSPLYSMHVGSSFAYLFLYQLVVQTIFDFKTNF